jgi:hypothetical protein
MRWIKSAFSWLVDQAIEHWPSVIFSAAGSALMAYLASITAWISQYGPVAWGAVGVATFLSLSLAFFLISVTFNAAFRRETKPSFV